MKTAVEWLQERYNKNINLMPSDFEQAKAMEKEQMIQSFRKGAVVHEPKHYTWIETAYRKQAEQYYNETYGKE